MTKAKQSSIRGNVHTADVMREVVLKFARKVAHNPHPYTHTYPEHTPREERNRRDDARFQVAQRSDEREWALVLSLAEQYDVSELALSAAIGT